MNLYNFLKERNENKLVNKIESVFLEAIKEIEEETNLINYIVKTNEGKEKSFYYKYIIKLKKIFSDSNYKIIPEYKLNRKEIDIFVEDKKKEFCMLIEIKGPSKDKNYVYNGIINDFRKLKDLMLILSKCKYKTIVICCVGIYLYSNSSVKISVKLNINTNN